MDFKKVSPKLFDLCKSFKIYEKMLLNLQIFFVLNIFHTKDYYYLVLRS